MDRWSLLKIRWCGGVLVGVALVVTLAAQATAAVAQPRGGPTELKGGLVGFFSGGGAPFGMAGKNAAEWLLDKWNNEGGIRGVKVKLIMVDEAGGPDKQVT